MHTHTPSIFTSCRVHVDHFSSFLCFKDFPVLPVRPCTSLPTGSIIAILHLTALKLFFSFSHFSLIETLNCTLSFALFLSASLYLPHSLSRRSHSLSLFHSRSNSVLKKTELDTEHLFAFDLGAKLSLPAPD